MAKLPIAEFLNLTTEECSSCSSVEQTKNNPSDYKIMLVMIVTIYGNTCYPQSLFSLIARGSKLCLLQGVIYLYFGVSCLIWTLYLKSRSGNTKQLKEAYNWIVVLKDILYLNHRLDTLGCFYDGD